MFWKHRITWESFSAPRGTQLRVHVALEAGRPAGIVPLLLTPEDRQGGGPWTFTGDFLITREPWWISVRGGRPLSS